MNCNHAVLVTVNIFLGQECRTFANSNFKKMYEAATCPEFQHELMHSVHKVIISFCEQEGLDHNLGKEFFSELQKEAFDKSSEELKSGETSGAAMW
jgi:hypothetical protein